ncbi:MAG: xanthine dehydrogenase family protein molybdopterin-binding subunit [Chloroflexi bacterium]|nr:xanthine dehydrogenase family protein molybdopterin-binding subunit [Chloroflexota bacterium]
METPSGGTEIGRSRPGIGQRRFVIGRGRYLDDLPEQGCLHVAFVRSPHPHARIRSVERRGALAAPGVSAVVVGDELAQAGPIPVVRFTPDLRVPDYRALSGEVVRFVGEPIAAVVAVTRAQAEDAAGLVTVEYEPLPPVTSALDALQSDAPALHPGADDNVCYRLVARGGDVEAAFARAARVVQTRVAHHRISATPLEPRGIIARWDSGLGELTVWGSSQTPHQLRDDLAAALGLPQHRVRAIVPDLGGGFGAKGSTYREDVAVAALARQLGRPVKWVSTRREDFLTTQHARDQVDEAEAAVDADGHILAIRTTTTTNLGAFLLGRSSRQALRVTQFGTGAYRIPAHQAVATTVFTNTTPTGAYRGAGRPEAAFIIERLMDAVARDLEIDPFELRRRNFLQPADFPYRTPNGAAYDSGDYPRLLERLARIAEYDRLRLMQAERRAAGELVGIGLATFVENTSAGWESGAVRVESDGSITVISGAIPMGQGVETVLAQIVADVLGVSVERLTLRFGDTALTQAAMGSFGSRSTAIAGSAVREAALRVKTRAVRFAARLLEAAADDVELSDDVAYVRGAPDRRVGWAEIAKAAYPPLGRPVTEEPGLEAQAFFGTEGEAISAGAYLAVISVERATGRLSLERLIAVDDSGTVINPLLAGGQIQGAIAAGIGEALHERVVYDGDGQLVTASLLDYALPTARQVVDAVTGHIVTPSPLNPLGAKGMGEAGIIGTPPAIVNAAIDALAPLGVRHLDLPLHSEKIWRLLRDADATC